MDVVCERCKAEYEFDDALVSERGTTVKCTNCSHQFKIFRPTSETDAAKVWNLRRPDGTVIPFDSLAVLQKWILEGKVSKMDEISRAGEGWKSLGAIAELESFFATAELRASQNAPGRTGQRFPSMSGVRAPTPAPVPNRATLSRPAPTLSSPTIRPGGAAPPPPPVSLRAPSHGGTPPPVPSSLRGPSVVKSNHAPHNATTMVQIPPPPKMPAEMSPPSSPLPSVDRHEPLADEVERARPRPPSLPPKVVLPPLPAISAGMRDLVDDQIPTRSLASDHRELRGSAAPGRRSGLGVGLVAGALIAGGALLVSIRSGVFDATNPSSSSATAARDLARRDRVIADATERSRRYSAAGMDEAREELTAAVALRPDDCALVATRAEVLAAWSEMLTQQADDLEAQAALPGVDVARLRASADLVRRDGLTRKERARTDLRSAEATLESVAGSERSVVEARLADVARVVGASTLATHLEAARRGPPTNESALYLALATLSDDSMAATAGLRAAIGAEPQNQRARVALARLLQRKGDVHGAQEILNDGLQTEPEHEALLGLSRALGSTIVVATPTNTNTNTNPGTNAVADGGSTLVAAVVPALVVPTPTAVPRPTTSIVLPAAPQTPHHGETSGAMAAAMAPTRDYDRLVRDADMLQHAGRTALARERYQQALAVRETGSEALTGLGFVELDQSAVGTAISRFRQALASNPRYSEAYIGLGEAYSHQRSYSQAVQAYQQYLAINPGGSRSEMARRQIESLQERMNAARAPEPSGDAATSP